MPKPPWTCPNCGRAFTRTGQTHVCERWTVEDHTRGKPAGIVDLFQRFVAAARTFGTVELAPVKGQVGLRGSHRIYAGAVLKPRGLEGYIDVARPIDSQRFRQVVPYTKRLWVHHFRITEPDEFDDEFVGWIGESFDVGEGRHLRDPP
ncbi:MAG: DUF5655 domain-containing protein [Mycobacteriales bacterium]|nr:MAG: hypothetical protein DLM56_13425 [Pseudonocardiales bacterium]